MRFLATLLGIILIIFGTLLIPFPDHEHFSTQQIDVMIKKVDSAVAEQNASDDAQTTAASSQDEEAQATDSQDNAGDVKVTVNGKKQDKHIVHMTFDPIIGAISLLVGIFLVFVGRKSS